MTSKTLKPVTSRPNGNVSCALRLRTPRQAESSDQKETPPKAGASKTQRVVTLFPALELFPHKANIDRLTVTVPVSRGQLVARLQPPLQAGRTCRPPGQGKDYKNREKSLLFPSDAVPAETSSSQYREMWTTHRFFSDFKIAEQCFPRSLSRETGFCRPSGRSPETVA